MSWIDPYPRAVLLTVLTVEALLLGGRLRRREARGEHLRLLFLLVSLAFDELAPAGPLAWLAAYAVAVSTGNALAPGHRLTLLLDLSGVTAAAVSVAAWAAGWRSGSGPQLLGVALLCSLCALPVVLVIQDRAWMGTRVLVAALVAGLLWLGGRLAGVAGFHVPAAGLPFALVTGVAIVVWWFTPDGPVAGHWYDYASRLEGRLSTTEGYLRQRDRLAAIGLLAAGAAHEFRGTLSAVGALAQWGRRGGAEAKDAALEGIAARVGEASRNVAGFLEGLSAEGRGPARTMSLGADLGHLVGFVRATCARDGTKVSFEVSGEPRITARAAEIEHVLLNLLHNAARAVAKGSRVERRITLRALEREGRVSIEVEDTGGGVPPAMVGRLFAPVGAGAEGSGVGLYLARSLAERNGGTIEYLPVPGGSLFRLGFAAAAEEGTAPPARSPS